MDDLPPGFEDWTAGSEEHLRQNTNGAGANGTDHAGARTLFWPSLSTLPRPEYLVKGVIDRGAFVEVFGPSGSGKSFLTADIGLHVAAGWPWFGCKVRQGGVLYVSAEGGAAIINRLRAFAQRHDLQLDELPFGVVLAATNLLEPSGVHQIIADAAAVPRLSLIQIDTAARVMPGGKEDTEAMGVFVAACDRIRTVTGAAVLAVHHSGKDVGRGSRGSTVLPAAVDSAISVAKDEKSKLVSAEIVKARDGLTGRVFAFNLDVVELDTDEDGEPITSCVVEPSDDTPRAGGRPVSGQAKLALDLLHRAIANAGEPRPASNHIPTGQNTVVRLDLWRRYCAEGTITDRTSPDTQQKAFKRSATKLQELGAIGIWGDYVWPIARNRTNRT